ncbi:hypothetical protein CEXT_161711 [Caerostris extrusa]|uniref:Uncharacterized protein n=1 Tax=Caerostris extrusa TaxID=172846 RepID=A0AAV4XY08_CAEEX|nr:hypothetical protein CEXT_161711 [Caerostris extrusa]
MVSLTVNSTDSCKILNVGPIPGSDVQSSKQTTSSSKIKQFCLILTRQTAFIKIAANFPIWNTNVSQNNTWKLLHETLFFFALVQICQIRGPGPYGSPSTSHPQPAKPLMFYTCLFQWSGCYE